MFSVGKKYTVRAQSTSINIKSIIISVQTAALQNTEMKRLHTYLQYSTISTYSTVVISGVHTE